MLTFQSSLAGQPGMGCPAATSVHFGRSDTGAWTALAHVTTTGCGLGLVSAATGAGTACITDGRALVLTLTGVTTLTVGTAAASSFGVGVTSPGEQPHAGSHHGQSQNHGQSGKDV